MNICQKLNIDLVGVPKTQIGKVPKEYEFATIVGSPMSPDMEILSDLNPDWVLSPMTLMSDLEPKYKAAGINYAFINLKSVPEMFKSIKDLGELFNKQKEAEQLITEFNTFYDNYTKQHKDKKGPKVLVLMGLPGSYVIATENSYAGSLVKLAGATNVYEGTDKEFLNVNTEDMIKKDPDIILRTAHAMPEEVMEMFDEDFKNNDIWKHFSAVKNKKVYDLPAEYFGMSATFDYQKALAFLDEILYQ